MYSNGPSGTESSAHDVRRRNGMCVWQKTAWRCSEPTFAKRTKRNSVPLFARNNAMDGTLPYRNLCLRSKMEHRNRWRICAAGILIAGIAAIQASAQAAGGGGTGATAAPGGIGTSTPGTATPGGITGSGTLAPTVPPTSPTNTIPGTSYPGEPVPATPGANPTAPNTSTNTYSGSSNPANTTGQTSNCPGTMNSVPVEAPNASPTTAGAPCP
jgi:hypothetical protein